LQHKAYLIYRGGQVYPARDVYFNEKCFPGIASSPTPHFTSSPIPGVPGVFGNAPISANDEPVATQGDSDTELSTGENEMDTKPSEAEPSPLPNQGGHEYLEYRDRDLSEDSDSDYDPDDQNQTSESEDDLPESGKDRIFEIPDNQCLLKERGSQRRD
jgi:hypothetical protein